VVAQKGKEGGADVHGVADRHNVERILAKVQIDGVAVGLSTESVCGLIADGRKWFRSG
jgi:hypothetical protein